MNGVITTSISTENVVKKDVADENVKDKERENKGGRPKKKEKNNKKKEPQSDPESESDISDMEKRRDGNMRRLIIADYHFQQLKQLLKNARIKELEQKKELALDHKGADFLRKKSDLDKKHTHKKDFINAMYTLGSNQFNRKKWAHEFMYSKDMYSDSRLHKQEKLIEQVENRILEIETHAIQSSASLRYVAQCGTNEKEINYGDMQRRKRKHQAALRRPIIVTGLDAASLKEDLKHVELMCAFGDIRDDHSSIRNSVFAADADSNIVREVRMEY